MMTPDDLELDKRVIVIEEALRGDLKGNPGLIQQLIRVMNDMYNPHEGHSVRIRRMEDWQNAKENWVRGAYFAWGSAGVIIGYLLAKFVIK